MTIPSKPAQQEWKKILSEETYRITREGGTEPPFTGRYWNHKTPGVYQCVCCEQPLFTSQHKYDSGSGWPSFYQPIDNHSISEYTDESHGMIRTEIRCNRCGAHLGHVFPDGPNPTGLRYCINSAALTHQATSECKPNSPKE